MKNKNLVILAFLAFQFVAFNGFSQNGKILRNVGYIPTWKYDCYQTVDYSALTHLNIAFCNPDKEGNMQNPFRREPQVFHDIVKKAHENGVKVIASLGGGGGGKNYPDLISTAENRTAFCEKIMQYVAEYDLDGVDLDLEENPDHVLWVNYEAWVKELRKQCTAKNKLLTSAVSTWFSDSMTDETFACFDYITLMAYDGAFDNHSSYEAGERMIQHYLTVRHVDADKIVLGLPFYGHRGGKYNAVGFKDIIAANPDAWDSDYVDTTSYNGVSTVKRKCELAKKYGGIMVWELSYDIEGEHSLLKAIKDSLYDGKSARLVNND
jgi:GH18 family chitinase